VRERLRAEAEAEGRAALHARLKKVDPESARRIHPNDLVRMVRALEVFELTGTRLSEHTARHGFGGDAFSTLGFRLHIGREELYERIDARVDEMIRAGLKEEVAALLDAGVSPDCKPMNSLGYRHLARHIAGDLDLGDAIRLMKRDTRRFAKRQLTWLRKEPGLVKLHPNEHEKAGSLAQEFLSRGAG
jgi:tRNA dimethylallyltransferase